METVTREETKGKTKAKASVNGRVRKSPKMWQVQRFYNLMCAVGLDDWISAALELQKEKMAREGRRPKTAADQLKPDEVDITEHDVETLSLEIDIGKVITHFGENGGLMDLVQIVMDVSEEEAEQVSLEDFQENFTPFVLASLRPIGMLLGFGQNLA